MADLPRKPDSQGDGDDAYSPAGRRPPGMPLWVKVFLIVAAALVLLFLVLQFVSGGEHGPRRHGGIGPSPPAGVIEDGGLRPPSGMHHGQEA